MRYLFRHYPFLGEESFLAAEASECAGEQGRFWEYHDKLFAEWKGEGSGAFLPPNLVRYAQELGLDGEAFSACLDSGRYREKVVKEREEGERNGVTSTPTVFINGQPIKGAQSFEAYRTVIEAELAAAP